MTVPVIETERLILRGHRLDDFEGLAAMWADPEVTRYIGGKQTMTARVRDFRKHLPRFLPLPHPSWRTTAWERKNPWFARQVLPELRRRVRTLPD